MSQQSASPLQPAYLEAAEELRGNRGQWQAYQSKGNCVVLAGPGSGKTKTLTIKLARMLAEDVRPPRAIACITYNNECVRELKRRLDKLGLGECSNLFVGTVHSFCLARIIKPYAKMAGLELPESFMVASPSVQTECYHAAAEDVFPVGRPVSQIEMTWYRRTYLDRDGPQWMPESIPVFSLIEAYEQELHSRGYIDFDDMMLLGLRLVEQKAWVRKLLRARYPILVVDEYQDLGLGLHRMVMTLCCGAGIRLFAVGDPDQSVYGFQGAKPELLQQLAAMDEIDDTPTLRMNYRCGTTIVEASECVLGSGAGQFKTPEGAPQGTVDFREFPDGIEQQAEQICEQIIPATLDRMKGRTLGDIAVLYVTRDEGDIIARAAECAGFDFIRYDRNAPYRKTLLTRWLEDCAAWCSGGWRQGEPRLSSLVRTWTMFNSTSGCSGSRALELKRRLVRLLWRHRDTGLSLDAWLQVFDNELLIDTFYRGCELQDEYEALDELLCACAPGEAIANFSVSTFAGQFGAPTHLNLITLHSAKGREFEVVIMMGMDQGCIPWINDTAEHRAEKRRLFYVGITRAKHEVHLTYSGWCYAAPIDRVFHEGPSEFVQELRERLLWQEF